jgi:hypothetical protein
MSTALWTRGWRGIVIGLDMPDGKRMYRPACFLFDTADGFAWIEPSYFDPPVSAPAIHEVTGGAWSFSADVVGFEGRIGADAVEGDMQPYRPEIDGPVIGEALDWWLREFLPQSGKTIAELRLEAAEVFRLNP